MIGLITLIFFAIAGILTGINFIIPYAYSKYVAVAIIACLDTVFGALAANINKKFKINTFLSGFFGNAIIAMFLTYIGEKLNVDIYLGVVIVFSGRLLNNFAIIRRGFVEKIDLNKVKEGIRFSNVRYTKKNKDTKEKNGKLKVVKESIKKK